MANFLTLYFLKEYPDEKYDAMNPDGNKHYYIN